MSQSPQTGQFNSYSILKLELYFNPDNVSIPSNGSIQFLQQIISYLVMKFTDSLNPLKRVNSILT